MLEGLTCSCALFRAFPFKLLKATLGFCDQDFVALTLFWCEVDAMQVLVEFG